MRTATLSIVTALIALAAGCGKEAPRPDPIEALTLYSIDGREVDPKDKAKSPESFHGSPVLGKVELPAGPRRDKVHNAFLDGMKPDRIDMAKCFEPRHGLRKVSDGVTTDFVICFHCQQVHVFEGETSLPTLPILSSAQATFDQALRDAGIPLADDRPPGY